MTPVLEKIRPLVANEFVVPASDIRFSASCFGGIDWSLKTMYTGQDIYAHQAFADQLRDAIKSVGARQAYAPTPTGSNAVIGLSTALTGTLSLGDGVYLRRNKAALMDGTFLYHRFDAGIFSAGGCGVIVVAYGNMLPFAHGSRESLLDRIWVESEGRERGRKNVSVVDSIIDALEVPAERMHLVHVWPLYFIKPEDFVHRADDELHGAYNRAAIRFLPTQFDSESCRATSIEILMDLPRIARLQCMRHGIPAANIHMEHCYLANDLPTTRSHEPAKRYLVAVARLN